MSGLGNAIQASVIKSFIPMIKENLPKLETQIGEVLRNVELEGMENYANIPYLFGVYLEGDNREDIITASKIQKDDSKFTKLYKLSKLKLNIINFAIKADKI